ncbi:MAG: magnesium transporter [Acidimicrobiia bacterium]|nr:magnesium transporter [Acidimicrobiia bacterium]
MSRRPRLPSPPKAIQRRREVRSRRLLAQQAVRDNLISVAGVIGRPVRLPSGAEVGRLADFIARWDTASYPSVSGLVVRVGRRTAFVPAEQVEHVTGDGVVLRSARLSLADFARRDGEVVLMGDVIDHQLVDVDGVRVVRAADLYLAYVSGALRLVGADVGVSSLLRRLGPARYRARPTPDRVVDWAAIQPFGRPGSPLRLRDSNRALHRLHPADLADLLEELGRAQRQELLAALEPDTAADALEEMEPRELEALLREAPPDQAAALLTMMEPDEAVDALRDLEPADRAELLAAMPEPTAHKLAHLLEFPERTAGGVMNPNLVALTPDTTLRAVREALRDDEAHRDDIDGVVVVDEDGCLVDDIGLFELFVADLGQRLGDLVDESVPTVIGPDAPLSDVVDRFIEGRHSSILVVDEERRPLGRIMADDVVDALRPEGGLLRGGILA